RLRVPYVVSPHGGYAPASFARSSWRKWLYAQILERRFVKGAALRVALTDVEAADLQAFGAGTPLSVIPNGVSRAPVDTDALTFRSRFGRSVGRGDMFRTSFTLGGHAAGVAGSACPRRAGSREHGGGPTRGSLERPRGLGRQRKRRGSAAETARTPRTDSMGGP